MKKDTEVAQVSKRIKEVQLKLGKLIFMQPRINPNKVGRELVVVHDVKNPITTNFVVKYSYYVRFFEEGNCAGNHYHRKKQELFVPIYGSVKIYLEDIKTGEKEEVVLESKEYTMLHIYSMIAHKVVANEPGSVLLVLATNQNIDDDEFEYKIDKNL